MIAMDVFDTTNSHHTLKFGKTAGLLLAASVGLPTSQRAFLLTDADYGFEGCLLPDEFLMCRPDQEIGMHRDLPRGFNAYGSELEERFDQLRVGYTGLNILAVPHPNLSLDRSPKERWDVLGGANISIDASSITTELVGKGFDVGQLTRGGIPHFALREENIGYPINRLAKRLKANQGDMISSSDYRKERETILSKASPFTRQAAELHVPSTLQLSTAKDIRFLLKLVRSIGRLLEAVPDNELSCLVNFYPCGPYVFEVVLSRRLVLRGRR